MAAIELGFDRIESANARETVVFLHGILGSAPNLRSVAKRFVEAVPGWTALLVDLRGHGRSPTGTPGASLAEAAEDVLALARSMPSPVTAVVGHSFGGKVALELLSLDATRLRHVVMLDSVPGAREPVRGGDAALTVLDTIESLPRVFASKRELTAALAARHGAPLAQWLAMSSRSAPGGVELTYDLAEIRALLLSYFSVDLWPLLETPRGRATIHLVIADRSSAFSPDDRARAWAIAAREPRVTVDLLDADHWVHVGDAAGVHRVLVERIGDPS